MRPRPGESGLFPCQRLDITITVCPVKQRVPSSSKPAGGASVVINAAGCGSRLGRNLPKSLVQICGHPILEWQLTVLCRNVDVVILVVGFLGETVAALARAIRPDVKILSNDRWSTTKTAASLSLGASHSKGRCLSLDGDLLVAPAHFNLMLHSDHDVIGVVRPSTSHPVYALLNASGMCIGFSQEKVTSWEWSGLVNFDPSRVPNGEGNVFEMIDCILPAAALEVQCVEVDTPEDLVLAEQHWPRLHTSPCLLHE